MTSGMPKRPESPPDPTLSVMVSVRLPAHLVAELDARAERNGCSRSEELRCQLEAALTSPRAATLTDRYRGTKR